jgi:hypothetical protein
MAHFHCVRPQGHCLWKENSSWVLVSCSQAIAGSYDGKQVQLQQRHHRRRHFRSTDYRGDCANISKTRYGVSSEECCFHYFSNLGAQCTLI